VRSSRHSFKKLNPLTTCIGSGSMACSSSQADSEAITRRIVQVLSYS
jgi:hypothetical protein